MENKEFRINNLLMYDEEIVPVVGLEGDNNDVSVTLRKHKVRVNGRSLKPIALTADWLSKLGFKESYRSASRVRFDLPNCCRYDFDLSKNKVLEGFLFFGNYIKCRYLHQLQNIYFALTGEELKIEEQFIKQELSSVSA